MTGPGIPGRSSTRPVSPSLEVTIVARSEADRLDLMPVFWTLVGDLAAEVLLDRVDGPWGTTETAKDGILAA